MLGWNIRAIAGLIGLGLASLSCATQYLWDDGIADQGVGASAHQVLAVGFASLPDQETITSIQFYNYSKLGHGHAINYHLWVAPPEGADLRDSTLVQTIATTIDAPQSTGGNWQSVAIAPTFIAAGTWFYVGISYDDSIPSSALCGLDQSPGIGNHSYVVNWSGPSQPGNLYSANTYFNFAAAKMLIRANGVPEPGSLVAISIGALMLLRRRRK